MMTFVMALFVKSISLFNEKRNCISAIKQHTETILKLNKNKAIHFHRRNVKRSRCSQLTVLFNSSNGLDPRRNVFSNCSEKKSSTCNTKTNLSEAQNGFNIPVTKVLRMESVYIVESSWLTSLHVIGDSISRCCRRSQNIAKLAKCISNPACAANVACLQTCNDRPDETTCQSDHTCIPEPPLLDRIEKTVEEGERTIIREVEEIESEVEKAEMNLFQRLMDGVREQNFLRELSKEEMDVLNELKMEASEVEELFGRALPIRKLR